MSRFPKLIVVEGGEFTGKTTLVKSLVDQLKGLGHRVVTYGSPNNFLPIGKVIREHLLSATAAPCDEIALGFAMLGALRELIQHITDNHLAFEGREPPQPVDYIILDRWYYTTLAYNNVGLTGLDMTVDCVGMGVSGLFENILIPKDSDVVKMGDVTDTLWHLAEYFASPDAVVFLKGAEVAFTRASESRQGEVHHNDLKSLEQFQEWEDRYQDAFDESSHNVLIAVEIGNRIEEITSQVLQELIDHRVVSLKCVDTPDDTDLLT